MKKVGAQASGAGRTPPILSAVLKVKGLLTARKTWLGYLTIFLFLLTVGAFLTGSYLLARITGTILALFIAGYMVSSSVLGFRHVVLNVSRGVKSNSWPTVEGVIAVSRIAEGTDPDGPSHDRTYNPVISYEYTVLGVSYLSDQLGFGSVVWTNKEPAKRVVSEYFTGRRIKVYYDPDNPQISTLEPGFNPGIFMELLLSSALLGLGILLFVGWLLLFVESKSWQ